MILPMSTSAHVQMQKYTDVDVNVDAQIFGRIQVYRNIAMQMFGEIGMNKG